MGDYFSTNSLYNIPVLSKIVQTSYHSIIPFCLIITAVHPTAHIVNNMSL